MLFFRLPNHILNPKTLDKTQSAGQESLLTRDITLVICAILYVSFSSNSKASNVFPKPILEPKACDESIQISNTLFCHVIVKNYLCNVLCKLFLIKIESKWRWESKKQTPQLTLLYCDRTVRSSQRRCSVKKQFLKMSQYPKETPVLESLLRTVAGLKACLFKETPT